jgi:hypothetical protein
MLYVIENKSSGRED